MNPRSDSKVSSPSVFNASKAIVVVSPRSTKACAACSAPSNQGFELDVGYGHVRVVDHGTDPRNILEGLRDDNVEYVCRYRSGRLPPPGRRRSNSCCKKRSRSSSALRNSTAWASKPKASALALIPEGVDQRITAEPRGLGESVEGAPGYIVLSGDLA